MTSGVAGVESRQSVWQTIVAFVLLFWMSGSLIVDLVIMPGLYSAGMMTQPDFATAGYSIFWIFNRIELVCAAIALTGLLWIRSTRELFYQRGYLSVMLAGVLGAIALLYTYALTPQMSALGIQLDAFESIREIPGSMNLMHFSYWGLELLKLTAAGTLLGLCQRNQI